jgi:hypothetical protein
LSWAASIAEAVSASAVEAFLEEAAEADVVHRPLRIEDRRGVLQHLDPCRTEAARRATVRRLWRSATPEVEQWPPHPEHEQWLLEDDLALQAELIRGLGGGEPEGRSLRPLAIDVYVAEGDEAQLATFNQLDEVERLQVTWHDDLFELAEGIVGHCLLEHTAWVLSNPSCPGELRERVRYPYDLATLELAVRAGPPWFCVARVRRMLGALDHATHLRFLTQIPGAYLGARQVCGLNTLDELTHGCLEGLDLSDRATAHAALGTAASWHWRRVPAEVIDILIHHPQAPHLAWVLAGHLAGELEAHSARRLVRDACPEIAGLALRWVPSGELTAENAELALATGPYWAARCPGIPASARPARNVPSIYELCDAEGWQPVVGASRRGRRPHEPFSYPPAIEALRQPYPQAPGWKVTLPESPAALARNAELMLNCTASFATHIDAGAAFIVVVESPEGVRYNVAVYALFDQNGETRYRVGEINSWANEGFQPAWLAGAITARLASPPVFEIPEPPVRTRRHRGRGRTRGRRRSSPLRDGRVGGSGRGRAAFGRRAPR